MRVTPPTPITAGHAEEAKERLILARATRGPGPDREPALQGGHRPRPHRGHPGDITAEPRGFLLPDGRLDFRKILHEFAAWWRLNGEFLVKGETYHEVAPQLIFMAYLQHAVNGGRFTDREYGVGRGRIDLLIRKPYTGSDSGPALQREAMELKVRAGGLPCSPPPAR